MVDLNDSITPEQKKMLTNYLEQHMKESGFYDKIIERADNLKYDQKTDIDTIYKDLLQYMTDNTPQEVQDAFLMDIIRVIGENKQK
ncbi:hypothetical protein M153_2520006887 [Pseudoloma neurophilia]|uniref:Transcription and mRNA export factor SUS1 n=1 Tax=Pseudoloma neurophilia TaxID=146866 RepID=A0A0R0M4F5_9MICR|nr:hypothetical protein M153_2520006887 [Pseudoloma neurophilia]